MLYGAGAVGLCLMLDAVIRGRPLFEIRHDGEEFLVGFIFILIGFAAGP